MHAAELSAASTLDSVSTAIFSASPTILLTTPHKPRVDGADTPARWTVDFDSV